MKVVFGWRRLTPPAFIGGAELTEATLAGILARAGHDVEYIGSFENPRDPADSARTWLESLLDESGIAWSDVTGGIQYWYQGIRCTSVSQQMVRGALSNALHDADVLFVSQEGCPALAELSAHTRVFSYVHSVSDVGLLSATIPDVTLVAPSLFVQKKLLESHGARATLLRPPLVMADRRAEVEDTEYVLFVNPVPPKGLEIALAVAKNLPDVDFLFLRTWPSEVKYVTTPNVQIVKKTLNMDNIYRKSSLLLVPSIVDDASPRVIPEASRFGIPAIGSPVGGIPELINEPSLRIDVSNIDGWTETVQNLVCSEHRRTRAGFVQLKHCQGLFENNAERELLRLLDH